MPFCQDTGYAVLFIELAQEVHIDGGSFYEALHEGVRQGYERGYLRKSLVRSPIERVNTGDNTPAIINIEIVPEANLGSIRVGKLADMIILDANPLADIQNSRRIHKVMKGGVPLEPASILRAAPSN